MFFLNIEVHSYPKLKFIGKSSGLNFDTMKGSGCDTSATVAEVRAFCNKCLSGTIGSYGAVKGSFIDFETGTAISM